MKQHLTLEQLNELSQEHKAKLFKKLFPEIVSQTNPTGSIWKIYDINYKYLTIGQMIEFLKDEVGFNLDYSSSDDTWGVIIGQYEKGGKELCDSLWLACKVVLEKKEI